MLVLYQEAKRSKVIICNEFMQFLIEALQKFVYIPCKKRLFPDGMKMNEGMLSNTHLNNM